MTRIKRKRNQLKSHEIIVLGKKLRIYKKENSVLVNGIEYFTSSVRRAVELYFRDKNWKTRFTIKVGDMSYEGEYFAYLHTGGKERLQKFLDEAVSKLLGLPTNRYSFIINEPYGKTEIYLRIRNDKSSEYPHILITKYAYRDNKLYHNSQKIHLRGTHDITKFLKEYLKYVN